MNKQLQLKNTSYFARSKQQNLRELARLTLLNILSAKGVIYTYYKQQEREQMKRKKYERKHWGNTTREEIEKEHYPIYWEVTDGEIIIENRRGEKLSKHHLVYTTEITFIQERIGECDYSGEICCV